MTEPVHPNDNDGNPIRGYAKTIFEATGVTDRNFLCEIEETMRHDIFHSTLDWQTYGQLQDAAKQAYNLITGGTPSPELKPVPNPSLRDYFAAAALTGIVTRGTVSGDAERASAAYELADAMMLKRR